MRLASHLGMSLDEVKMKTSASQYILWMEYLDWEINAFDKHCYYLAQIAAVIAQVNSKKRIKIEDFIMKFSNKKPEEQKLDTQTRANRVKQFFFGLTGFTKGKR